MAVVTWLLVTSLTNCVYVRFCVGVLDVIVGENSSRRVTPIPRSRTQTRHRGGGGGAGGRRRSWGGPGLAGLDSCRCHTLTPMTVPPPMDILAGCRKLLSGSASSEAG